MEDGLYHKYKCGFFSSITLIQSGQTIKHTHKQTNKQTHTQQSSFNNTSPSVSVALRPLFDRARHYATQLTQFVQNFLRKSTSGYSIDSILMNILGYSAYSAFNVSLYWSAYIQEEYFSLHPGGVNPVRMNDVVFAVHALIFSLLILSQFIYYSRSIPVSSIACSIMTLLLLAIGITAFLAFLSVTTWLNFLYVLSYVKLIITLLKYIPQAWINFKTKSTAGFSIEGVWLDFSGGVLSILQMVILAYNFNDWLSILGDFVKFWLGAISISFDVIFLLQHYILYRSKEKGFSCFGAHVCRDKNESLLG